MRHETCLSCQLPAATDPSVNTLVLVTESLGGPVHHHHTVTCGGCGQWWFDDVAIGGLGIPVPRRRDTELCGCDDGLPQYTLAAVMVPSAEDDCACTKAEVERFSLPVRVGTGRPEPPA